MHGVPSFGLLQSSGPPLFNLPVTVTCAQAVAILGGPKAAAQPLPGADYLLLSPEQRAAAYVETARRYTEAYGEPYDDVSTAWLPADLPYPLATPANPLFPLLRAFDDNPALEAQTPAIHAAASALGVAFPPPGAPVRCWACAAEPVSLQRVGAAPNSPVALHGVTHVALGHKALAGPPCHPDWLLSRAYPCRSSAHALFTTWLASKRAETVLVSYVEMATTSRCACPGRL
jgi:hypothetical protein